MFAREIEREGGKEPGEKNTDKWEKNPEKPPLVCRWQIAATQACPAAECLTAPLLPRLHLLSRERFRLLLVLDLDARSLPPRLLGLCVTLRLARLGRGIAAVRSRSRRFPLLRRRSSVLVLVVARFLVFFVGNVRVFVFVKVGTKLSQTREMNEAGQFLLQQS